MPPRCLQALTSVGVGGGTHPASLGCTAGYFIYGTVDGVSFQPKDVPVGPVALKLVGG